MLKMLLTNKGPYFEFICVTMPDLEPPLEESGYGPEVSNKYNVIHKTHVSHVCPHKGFYVCTHVHTCISLYMHV